MRAKKKRDTFVVSRWRGRGACRSRAPHRLRRACERSRGSRGETIRAVRAMTTAKTTEATEATCRAAKTPRAARATMRATSTEAEAVAWDMVGAVSALTIWFMGFSL